MIRKIEIDFALPVELTESEERALYDMVSAICKRHRPEGWAFWPAGVGQKPSFSAVDARMLGKPGLYDPSIPDRDEPTFDAEVFQIDCAARELYPEEIERRRKRR